MDAVLRRELEVGLRGAGCTVQTGARHVLWTCNCSARHQAVVPRALRLAPAVRQYVHAAMICLPQGWMS